MRRLATAVSLGLLLGLLPVIGVAKFLPKLVVPVVTVAGIVSAPAPSVDVTVIPWQAAGVATPASHPTRILFVGDMMFDRKVAEHINQSRDPSYPFRKLPEGWFASFDYSVANLEGPVVAVRRPSTKTIDFRFDPSVVATLKQEGISAVSQANNHSLDQGTSGFEESRRLLQEGGLLVFGSQIREDDIALATTTVNGLRLAFIGFNTTDHPMHETAAATVLAKAKAQADRVVVFMHWGLEYQNHPTADMVSRAHWLIDHGADAAIGSHPHWVQGIESYKGHPIAYSLGNFIFDQYFSSETQEGLGVVLSFDGPNVTVEPIPIRSQDSQPRLVDGQERTDRLKKLAGISEPDLQPQIEAGSVEFHF